MVRRKCQEQSQKKTRTTHKNKFVVRRKCQEQSQKKQELRIKTRLRYNQHKDTEEAKAKRKLKNATQYARITPEKRAHRNEKQMINYYKRKQRKLEAPDILSAKVYKYQTLYEEFIKDAKNVATLSELDDRLHRNDIQYLNNTDRKNLRDELQTELNDSVFNELICAVCDELHEVDKDPQGFVVGAGRVKGDRFQCYV